MKKLASALLFIILFFNLIGCTPTTDPNATHTEKPVQPTLTSSHIEEPQRDMAGALIQPTATPIKQNTVPVSNQNTTAPNGQLKVHYIDVGQADSILIQTPQNGAMLIDAGNDNDGISVTAYLKSQGIRKINVVIGTHPHEDHVGGLDAVINSFDIGSLYMPDVSSNTNTFNDVMKAAKNKGLAVTPAKAGVSIALDNTLKTQIVAPNRDSYEDLNNYSAVVKMTYKNTSFLFTGDAESISEKEMLSAGFDLKADVLKVGHHGSGFSTSALFLKKVSPKYAIISVGKNNSYNHPDNLILNRLKTYGVESFRTDMSGTIIATSDGNTIKFDKKASPIKSQAPPKTTHNSAIDDTTSVENAKTQAPLVENKELTVYVTKSGKKYHSNGCQYLSKSKISINLEEAKSQGFTPCSKCHPPH